MNNELQISIDAYNDDTKAIVPYFQDKWQGDSGYEEETPFTQYTSLIQSDKVMVNNQKRNDRI